MEPTFTDEACPVPGHLEDDPDNCDAWISAAVMGIQPGRGFRVPAEFAPSFHAYVLRGRQSGADIRTQIDSDGTCRAYCTRWMPDDDGNTPGEHVARPPQLPRRLRARQ